MKSGTYASRLAKAGSASELAVPESTYRERISRVRTKMAENNVDTLLITHSCDLNYLTGYNTICFDIYACLILPLDGEPILHTMNVEIPAAINTTWIDEAVFVDWFAPDSLPEQLVRLLEANQLNRGVIGVQPRRQGMSAELYLVLSNVLSEAKLVDHTDLVARLRLIKSPQEIEFLRQAAQYTAAGINASLGAIRVGCTDNDVCRAGFDAMVAAGSDFLSIQPIVTSGKRTGGFHQTHRRNKLVSGDLIFMEYGGCFNRYTAPMMRSACLGKPSAEVLMVEANVLNCVDTLLAAIRPGRQFHDVAIEAKRAHEQIADLAYFLGAYGYTVGIGFPPTWAESICFIAEGSQEEFEPGMVFHLPIGMRVPGKFGVSLSETVLVNESGCETLTNLPRKLQIIDR